MKSMLITGGAGFIGCNASAFFAKEGWKIFVFDNLSRKGTELNIKWLRENYDVTFIKGDTRDYQTLKNAVEQSAPDVIIHLAAQVAVTTSVTDPREDFEINALGSFNLLEAVRELNVKPLVIYSSTNKVYGGMEEVKVIEKDNRYVYADYKNGIPESSVLDFHSPYGCSKGAADQYMRDYFRIYDIPTVVLRQSCIYGKRQFGIEDQGWVAWFTIATALKREITIYGDGKQVRDVLYIDDLINAYNLCIGKKDNVAGKIYNIGGGAGFTMNLLELVEHLEKLYGFKINPHFSDWRPGDQRVYISDISMVQKDIEWEPKVSPLEGVKKLFQWVNANKNEILEAGV